MPKYYCSKVHWYISLLPDVCCVCLLLVWVLWQQQQGRHVGRANGVSSVAAMKAAAVYCAPPVYLCRAAA